MNVWSHFIISPIKLSFIYNFLSYNHASRSRFLDLNTSAILSYVFLCSCSVHCWPVYLTGVSDLLGNSSSPNLPWNYDNPKHLQTLPNVPAGENVLSKEPLLSDKRPNEVVKRAWALEPADAGLGPQLTSFLCDTGHIIDHSEPQFPYMCHYYSVGILVRLNEIQSGTWQVFSFQFSSLLLSKVLSTYRHLPILF